MEGRKLRETGTEDVNANTPDRVSDRRAITAAVVEQIDHLLAQGTDHAVIATGLGVTQYVVDVIAGDKIGKGRKPHQRKASVGAKPHQGVDAATVRRVERMLEVGWLNHRQIAREAGVHPRTLAKIAAGCRVAASTERPIVFSDLGERFLPEPVRCGGCGGMIEIVPCRACRAVGGEAAGKLGLVAQSAGVARQTELAC